MSKFGSMIVASFINGMFWGFTLPLLGCSAYVTLLVAVVTGFMIGAIFS